MAVGAHEHAVRAAAFEFLQQAVDVHGEDLPWRVLTREFMFDGIRVPLINQQGIFKPAILELPISITTAPEKPGRPRPYADELGTDGVLRYRYRGQDPQHHENRGLRTCHEQRIPLIYFYGIAKGIYRALWPVLIVGDDPSRLTFDVQVDDCMAAAAGDVQLLSDSAASDLRRYTTVLAKRRLHQAAFRIRVLRAYMTRCSICRLKEALLLEAAHIKEDMAGGNPAVSNGIALCQIHHRAFDRRLLAIRPDYSVEVHPRILAAKDGPMLVHGLQAVHGVPIHVPKRADQQPDRALLEARLKAFRLAT